MKTGPLIVAVGGGFSLALLVFAMFADDMWEDDDYDDAPPIVAGIPSPHRDGRENMACSTCHRIMGRKLVGADGIAPAPRNPNKDTPPIVAGTPSPHRDGRENIACSTCHKIVAREGVGAQGNAQTATSRNVATPGLVPSIGTDTWRYQGNVKKIMTRGANPGGSQVHIWVGNGVDTPQQISLAPDWYLQRLGCPIVPNIYVKGAAFGLDNLRPDAGLHAKTVSTNGKICRLRNDAGIALWSGTARAGKKNVRHVSDRWIGRRSNHRVRSFTRFQKRSSDRSEPAQPSTRPSRFSRTRKPEMPVLKTPRKSRAGPGSRRSL